MTGVALALSTLGGATTPKKKPATPSTKASYKAGKKPVSGKKAKSRSKAKQKKGAWKRHGQQTIASDRTREIQEALVNAGYLTSTPTGKMDAATKQALVKLQKENGWQTKVVPDSRALIRLGLGPDHSNLLNPKTAMLPGVSSTASASVPSPE